MSAMTLRPRTPGKSLVSTPRVRRKSFIDLDDKENASGFSIENQNNIVVNDAAMSPNKRRVRKSLSSAVAKCVELPVVVLVEAAAPENPSGVSAVDAFAPVQQAASEEAAAPTAEVAVEVAEVPAEQLVEEAAAAPVEQQTASAEVLEVPAEPVNEETASEEAACQLACPAAEDLAVSEQQSCEVVAVGSGKAAASGGFFGLWSSLFGLAAFAVLAFFLFQQYGADLEAFASFVQF
eukprot:gnl/Hemi2/17800_TR5872_c0_g1_i1.p1 gnl/Hemi2/17800_TR5872_c0_g1~~gnl/Hemi2/17800_TR5872_c0_g1_i1.p1  ORF type:complete len:236 (+),score=103.62 gnl/Hemi2/17800_TR5872_c0_g1_i1:85-792(+)